jgi:hypothetical protein
MPFNYHSEQVNQNENKTRKNIVNIKNNKGTKRVEEYDSAGKLIRKSEKPLSKPQIRKIKKNIFIPGLFKDCIGNSCSPSKTTARRKTRRTNRHRN